MTEDRAREDIAFIRSALEEGRSYAQLRSPDITVWGGLIAVGYLCTYAFVSGTWPVAPAYSWWTLVAIGWLFSLRHLWARSGGECESPVPSQSARILRAVWLGFGITMVSIAVMQDIGGLEVEGLDIIVAGLLGLCFFATAEATGLTWLRWIAICWWASEFAFFLLHGSSASLLLGAALMFCLLGLPGLALWLRRPALND